MKRLLYVWAIVMIRSGLHVYTYAQGIGEPPYIPNVRDHQTLQRAEAAIEKFAKAGEKEMLVYIIGRMDIALSRITDPKSQFILYSIQQSANDMFDLAVQVANNPGSGSVASSGAATETGTTVPPKEYTTVGAIQTGKASYYATSLEKQTTANGDIFMNDLLTAAHLTHPFGTKVKVTNLKNQQRVVVRINDRGPYVDGRVIDLSQTAFRAINSGSLAAGILNVKLEVVVE